MKTAEIHALDGAQSKARSNGLRELKDEFGLNVIQLSEALGTSSSNVELWLSNKHLGPSVNVARSKIEVYLVRNLVHTDANLLFDIYPLSFARNVLMTPIGEIASEFGYTEGTWRKFEANVRAVPIEVIKKLEERLRLDLAKNCVL